MMKFICMMLMMIPLSFFGSFWFSQLMWYLMSLVFMFNFGFYYLYMNVAGEMGLAFLSFMLVLLSFLICALMVMASEKKYSTGNWSGFFMKYLLFCCWYFHYFLYMYIMF